MASLRLSIRQIGGSRPAQFQVFNNDRSQAGDSAEVPSPYEWAVQEGGNDRLMTQLRWLLEVYLSHPFEPNMEKAVKIEAALKEWGTAAFKALFDNREAGAWLPNRLGEEVDLVITCDDPELLAWPWEALHDPKQGRWPIISRRRNRMRCAVF